MYFKVITLDVFVNGLPLVVIELKSPTREETNVSEAYLQLRNYMKEIPSLFWIFNERPLINNFKVITLDVFVIVIYQVDDIVTLFFSVEKRDLDSMLKIVHEKLISLW